MRQPSRGGSAETWGWLLLTLLFAAALAQIASGHLPWAALTLPHDLPWAGLVLALGGLVVWVLPTGVRMQLGGVFVPRWAWLGAALATATLVVLVTLPAGLAARHGGLSLRTGPDWGVPDGATAHILVRRLTLDARAGPPWGQEAFHAVLSGWLYAPLTGDYEFAVGADGDALFEIDGRMVLALGRPAVDHPHDGITNPTTGIRRAGVYLRSGFHRLQLISRHEVGAPRLLLRWIPLGFTRPTRIPREYLLPEDARAPEVRVRAMALAGRRFGVLGLGLVAVAATGAGLAVVRGRLVPGQARPVGRAAAAAVAAASLTLTGRPVLFFWAGQLDALRMGLAAVIAGGMLTALVAAWVRHRRAMSASGWFPGESWPTWLRSATALGLLLSLQVALTLRFLAFVGGRLPGPGDHGSFLYRYHLLLHTLPRLQGYDPWWNAGAIERGAAITGGAGTLALSWPLLWFRPLAEVYPALIPLVGVFVAPWSLFAAIRLLGGSRFAALLGALLALAPDDYYFYWLSFLGTLPALIAAAFATLTVALIWRVFVRHDPRRWLVVVLGTVLAVGLFWGLFVLMVGPTLLVGAAVCRRRLRRLEVALAAGLVAILFLVHGQWVLSLVGAPQVTYVRPTGLAGVEGSGILTATLRVLDVMVVDANPLVIVGGIVGLFCLPGPLRAFYGVFTACLFLVATLGGRVFPGLELGRFLIPLSFALIVPAAWLAARLLRATARTLSPGPSAVAGAGLLIVLLGHVDGVWRQYAGEARLEARQMEFQSEETRQLIQWIRTSTSPGTRILLWGHQPSANRLGGGFPAFLPVLTGRAMVGRPQNAKYVDLDLEKVFRSGELRARLELFNIRYVVIPDDFHDVQAYVGAAPDVALHGVFPLFRVYEADVAPAYLLGARGTVKYDYDRLEVRLDEAAEVVTLKFRWTPALVADAPVSIEPVEVAPGVRFIRVRPAGLRDFRIRHVGCCPWHPVERWARQWTG